MTDASGRRESHVTALRTRLDALEVHRDTSSRSGAKVSPPRAARSGYCGIFASGYFAVHFREHQVRNLTHNARWTLSTTHGAFP